MAHDRILFTVLLALIGPVCAIPIAVLTRLIVVRTAGRKTGL